MRTQIALAFMAALSVSACSESLDERFERACAEQQAAGGEIAEVSADACKYGEYLSPEERERIIQVWEAYRDQGAEVNALREQKSRALGE